MEDSHAAIEHLAAIDLQGTLASRPNAAVRGRYYMVVDPGQASDGLLFRDSGAGWTQVNRRAATVRHPHGFTISGDVLPPAGDLNYVPPLFLPVPAGQTVVVTGVRSAVRSGTEVVFTVTLDGQPASAALTGVRATTTATTVLSTVAVATSGQALGITVTSVTGSPRNLSATVYADYTA